MKEYIPEEVIAKYNFECYICGKEIPKGSKYLYEVEKRTDVFIINRRSHLECNHDAT